MGRFIFVLAAAVLLYLLVKSFSRKAGRDSGTAAPASPQAAEDMVRCEQCGVHLPRSEAILSSGKFYCCDDHRRARQAAAADGDGK